MFRSFLHIAVRTVMPAVLVQTLLPGAVSKRAAAADLSVSCDYWGINTVFRYGTSSGQLLTPWFEPGGINGPWRVFPTGLAYGPDGNFYVHASVENQDGSGYQAVLMYDGITRQYLGDFVTAPELSGWGGIAFGPDGNLYEVQGSSSAGYKVVRYSGTTGEYMDDFVTGGLTEAGQLAFGPGGNLFVESWDEVMRYDGVTGALLDIFIGDDPSTPGVDESGGMYKAHGLTFGPDGNLYVSGIYVINGVAVHGVAKYNAVDGTPMGLFAGDDPSTPGLDEGGGLYAPMGVAFGPDGHLFVCSYSTSSVMRYDGQTGAPLGTAGDPYDATFAQVIAPVFLAISPSKTSLPGDIDGDSDVDLNDFATFANCFSGGATTPPPGCAPADFAAGDLDGDGDMDLNDFATFANNFTG